MQTTILNSIDLQANKQLVTLDVSENNLATLNVTNNSILAELYCAKK